MHRFAVFISDPGQVGEFIGVLRVNVEAVDEIEASQKAVRAHSEERGMPFTEHDVALCVQIATTAVPGEVAPSSSRARNVRMF